MEATTTLRATAPRMPVAPSQGIQRECTLCGRVVTNIAAHAGFMAAEGLSLAGVGYAVYVASLPLGVISGGFLIAAGMGQYCWYRFRNVRALGDAATNVQDAAGSTLAAVQNLELGTSQAVEAARLTSVAAARVLSSAEQLAVATSATEQLPINVEEVRASAASISTSTAPLPLQLNEISQLLSTTSLLARDISAALTDIKRASRSNSSEISQIAELEARFQTVFSRLSGGLTAGIEEHKQVVMIMSETSNLSMQILRQNIAMHQDSLAEKNRELAALVDRADAAISQVTASQQARDALAARLEQLQRENEALQTRIGETVGRLEAERARWTVEVPLASASITQATASLASERAGWDATVLGLGAFVDQIAAIRRGHVIALPASSDSSRVEPSTGDAKTGE